ncbi:Nudix hydrolase 25 [Capsicum annuum]|uniref:Nudix hydrolase 25 n=1 Tax=Capsicum annuum TaxID=4072 RepID=A0A2G2YCC7_CAPAN|nr:Nudix hydrolase 25 [Capsicum annuum]PHT67211.1 Nudix hydrolase 25 [Capsicum annuum]
MVAESLFCVLLNFTFGYFFHLVWKSCRLFSSVASLGIVVLVKRILILRFAAYTFCASLGVFTQYLFSIDQILLDGSSIGLGSFWFGVLLTRERRESCISFLVSSGDLVVSNYAFDIFDSDTAHWVLKVFVASRLNVTGAWQIPQGVTEDREDSKSAAIRELWEETGITSAEIIAKVPQWLTYDFPLAVKVKVNSLWGGEWHGQAQTRKAVDYKRPTYEEEVRKMMVAKLLNANQQKGESCACCLHTVLIPYTGIQSFVSSLYMNLSAKICIYRLVI